MCVKDTEVNPIHNILWVSFEPFTQDYHRNITNLQCYELLQAISRVTRYLHYSQLMP